MDINYEKGTITIFGKATKIDVFVRQLSSLSGEQIYHFLSNRNVLFPRKFNCMALVSVLNDKIKFLVSKSLPKNYFERLAYYDSFTETLLVDLFNNICNDDESFAKYRHNLFKLVILNAKSLELNDGELNYIKTIRKEKMETFDQYVNYISASSVEMANTFDGVDVEILKTNLAKAARMEDIQIIKDKYGIDIPERLSKEEYLAYIEYYLNKNGNVSDDLSNELAEMSLANLSMYARRNGISMQPLMTKEDVVDYLFYYLEQCEILTSSITEIASEDIYDPLKFRVDLKAISLNEDEPAKKVISYDGDEADADKLQEVLDSFKVEEVEEEDASTDFIGFSPIEKLKAPILPGELAPIQEYKEEPVEDISDEKIDEILENSKQKEVVDDTIDLDVTAIKNNDYASEKLKSLNRVNKFLVLSIVGGVFAALVLALVVYSLIR